MCGIDHEVPKNEEREDRLVSRDFFFSVGWVDKVIPLPLAGWRSLPRRGELSGARVCSKASNGNLIGRG